MADNLIPGREYGWSEVSQVHRQHHGINSKDGVATSIWFETKNGAPYEDRWLAAGQVLDYVGHGKGPKDQAWDQYNVALRRAMEAKARVTVFEKIRNNPSRFIFHGKWHVLEATTASSPDGRRLIRFVISSEPRWQGVAAIDRDAPMDTPEPPPRVPVTTLRIVRDSLMARRLKRDLDHTCEICGLKQLRGNGSPYAEAHHIMPLHRDGPDVKENLVVVCAQHHVDFDYGAVAIDVQDRATIHHRHDPLIEGRRLKRRLPTKAIPYLQYHWREIYKGS